MIEQERTQFLFRLKHPSKNVILALRCLCLRGKKKNLNQAEAAFETIEKKIEKIDLSNTQNHE